MSFGGGNSNGNGDGDDDNNGNSDSSNDNNKDDRWIIFLEDTTYLAQSLSKKEKARYFTLNSPELLSSPDFFFVPLSLLWLGCC